MTTKEYIELLFKSKGIIVPMNLVTKFQEFVDDTSNIESVKIILENPAEAVSIFGKLFKKTPIPMILKFLYEETTLYEEASIFKKLPAIPFLKQIFK